MLQLIASVGYINVVLSLPFLCLCHNGEAQVQIWKAYYSGSYCFLPIELNLQTNASSSDAYAYN